MYKRAIHTYAELRHSDYWIGDDILVSGSRNMIRLPDKEEIKLQPRLISVLTVLACSPDQVVPRRSIIDAVWDDFYTGDFALNQCISRLRKVLLDSTEHPHIIETVVKSGYRLLLPIRKEQAASKPISIHARILQSAYKYKWAAAIIAILVYVVFAQNQAPQPVIMTEDPQGLLTEEMQSKIQQLAENPEAYDEIVQELKKVFPDSTFQINANDGQSLLIYNK